MHKGAKVTRGSGKWQVASAFAVSRHGVMVVAPKPPSTTLF